MVAAGPAGARYLCVRGGAADDGGFTIRPAVPCESVPEYVLI